MPRIVDHDERRRHVAAVAARLVAEGGIDAATVREVAAAAGTSTAIVCHYFRNKRELLQLTFAHAAGRARHRIDAVMTRDPADVRGLCEALLPLDDERRDDWRVWFAFWAPAVADPALGADQQRRVRDTRQRMAVALALGPGAPSRVVAEREARRILTVVTGIAAQAVFDPEEWSPARQRSLLRDELAR